MINYRFFQIVPNHSILNLYLKSNGTLWAWGYNLFGQLGDGTTSDKITPVQIGTNNSWTEVTGGSSFSIALNSDGTLWSWGFNGQGQLGDGTTTDKHSPIHPFNYLFRRDAALHLHKKRRCLFN